MYRGYDEKMHEKFAAGKPLEQLRKNWRIILKLTLKSYYEDARWTKQTDYRVICY
jgi:hypothetical protein